MTASGVSGPDRWHGTGSDQLRMDLHRARAALVEAELSDPPADRFAAAHLAALRMAAIVLSVRARSTRPGPRNAWVVLSEAAPEFAEWAAFFAATQPKRKAIEQGARYAVSTREADDLVRDAGSFLLLVERSLQVAGLSPAAERGERQAVDQGSDLRSGPTRRATA